MRVQWLTCYHSVTLQCLLKLELVFQSIAFGVIRFVSINLRMIISPYSYILFLLTQSPAGEEIPHTHRPEAVDVLQNRLKEAEELRKQGHADRASEVHVIVC